MFLIDPCMLTVMQLESCKIVEKCMRYLDLKFSVHDDFCSTHAVQCVSMQLACGFVMFVVC